MADKLELPDCEIGEFSPCAFENTEMGFTEIILEDCMTVWQSFGGNSHFVDLGYHPYDGRLVGVRVWGLVLKCNVPAALKTEMDAP